MIRRPSRGLSGAVIACAVTALLALVLTPTPAAAQALGSDGWVWPSGSSLTRYPAADPEGSVGAVVVPDNWRGAMCNAVFTGSSELPGSSPNFGTGSTIGFRCYVKPTTGTVTISSTPLLTLRRTTGFHAVGVVVSQGLYCTVVDGETDLSQGRVSVACGMLNGYEMEPLIPAAREGDDGTRFELGLSGVFVGGTSMAMYSWGADTPLHPFLDVVYSGAPGTYTDPTWPQFYPVGAVPPDAENAGAAFAPKLRCQSRWSVDANGNPRVTVTATVLNPPEAGSIFSDEDPKWAYSWEREGGEPSSADYWTEGPVHEGYRQERVIVPDPLEDEPQYATFQVRRIIEDEEMLGSFPIGGLIYGEGVFLDELAGRVIVDALLGQTPSQLWFLDGLFPESGYTMVGDSEYTDVHQATAWRAAEGRCVVPLDPSRAGDPDGDVTIDVQPPVGPGTGGGADDGNPDEDDEDGDGCETPDGWSMLNPIAWVSAAGCAFGNFLGDLLAALLDLLRDLFLPSPGFMDGKLADLQAAFAESGLSVIGFVGEAFVNSLTTFADAADDGPSSCRGPTFGLPIIPTLDDVEFAPLDACDPPLSTMATLTKTFTSLAVLLGGGAMVVRIVLRSFEIDSPFRGGDE